MKKFLHIFVFVLTVASLLCFSAFAEVVNTTFTDDNEIEWKVSANTDTQKATITGVNLTKATTAVSIPEIIFYNGADYTVTAIGNNAFKEQTMLFGKLSLPSTFESIGSNAFEKTNIYGDVVIPDSVASIGSSAFYQCKGLLTIKLPASMKAIANSVFQNCYSLVSVESENVIESFGTSCFSGCFALHSIKIGKGTTTIGGSAFLNCRGLDGDLDLTTVISLGDNAFKDCYNITGVSISNTNFNLNCFSGCKKIEYYSVADGNVSYKTVDGVLYNKAMTTLYRYPAQKDGAVFKVPKTVTTIESDAFYHASNIGKIEFERNDNNEFVIKTIGANAFRDTGVDYFYFPDSVTSIGESALADCENLVWVVISKNVASASKLVSACEALQLVIGRHASFNTSSVSAASGAVCKRANQYTCTSHIYGFLDDGATCTESGINTCIICDRSSYVKPLGHEGAIVEKSTLDCTTDYYIIVDCTRCGIHDAKTIFEKAPGHVSTPTVVAPTATTPGFTVETCSVCNETIISNYTASFYLIGDINNDGSINNNDSVYLASYLGGMSLPVTSVACDINGDRSIDIYDLILLRRYVAKIDTEIKTTSEGCEKHFHVGTLVASESTCVDDGIEITYCLDCGVIISTLVTEKQGHSWNVNSRVEPNCLNAGFDMVSCTTCKLETILTVEKLPHTESWWVMPSKPGYEYNICNVCNTLESRLVDYSQFDALVAQLPEHYESYYTNESLSLLNPILANYELALTQDMVDKSVEEFKAVFPRLQYNITDVPVIYINSSNPSKLNANTYIDADTITVAYYDENGKYVNYIENNGEVKIRGNSTAGKTKKPYNIKFSTNVNFFDMGEDNKYCLLANAIDPGLMRGALVREFNQTCGLDYGGKYKFVEVYCDGSHRGVYLMCTPVDVEETRIDIDEETDAILEIEEDFSTAGCIYFNRRDYNPFFFIRCQIANTEDLNGEGYSKTFSTLIQAEYAIMSGDYEQVKQYFDVDSMARYYVLCEYMKDTDFFWDSTRFYIEDGKIHGGPAWDYDRSMGHVSTTSTDKSRYGYYNKTIWTNGVYGDSTTGEWANGVMVGAPTENWQYTFADKDWKFATTDTSYTWFTYLYHYSPEFMELVGEIVWELKDEMTLMYADVKDELGKVTTNVIDRYFNDNDTYDAFVRDAYLWGVPQSADEGWKFDNLRGALNHLRDWLEGRHLWMINHYSEKQLAEYAASLADKVLVDEFENQFANATTAKLTTIDGVLVYQVTVNLTSSEYADINIKALFNKVQETFKENKCYTHIVVNGYVDDELVSTYSTSELIESTFNTVTDNLTSGVYNQFHDSTKAEMVVNENGVIVINIEIEIGDISSFNYTIHKDSITELVKNRFEKQNIYAAVSIKYFKNGAQQKHYYNGLDYVL